MGTGTKGTLGGLAIALAALAGGGCKIADANVANLRELHDPDGSPRRVGIVQSDVTFMIRRFFAQARLGSPRAFQAKPDRIDDPLGECLEQVLELADCDPDDPRIRGLQVELFGWLAVDCTYTLSRERCTKELGRLGRELGVTEPAEPDPERPRATPDDVARALEELLPALRPFLEGGRQGFDRRRLDEACAGIRALELDREGARRMLSAMNALVGRARRDDPELEDLRALHAELQRRYVALSYAPLLGDPEPLVRAAALEAGVAMTRNRAPGLVRSGLDDPAEEVVLRALDVLARHGMPEPEEPLAAEERERYERSWRAALARLLANAPDGAVSIAACQAMARVSEDGGKNLRPEVWVARFQEEERARVARRTEGTR